MPSSSSTSATVSLEVCTSCSLPSIDTVTLFLLADAKATVPRVRPPATTAAVVASAIFLVTEFKMLQGSNVPVRRDEMRPQGMRGEVPQSSPGSYGFDGIPASG